MLSRTTGRNRKTLLRLRVDSLGEAIYHARHRLVDVLHRLGFLGEDADAIELAFTEALANAVRYGSVGPKASVHVRVIQDAGQLVVEVTDHGSGFQPRSIELPNAGDPAEGGRGLYLMRAFMDDVAWLVTPHGTTVRMTKRVPNRPPAMEDTA